MSNEFGKYLSNYLEKNNYKIENFAKEVGYSTGLISHYTTGKRSPSYKFIEAFFKKFNFSNEEKEKVLKILERDKMPDSLKKLKTHVNTPKANAIILEEEFINVPVKAKASAGNGYINCCEDLYMKTIRKNGFHEYCYLIEVCGNSMEPLIQDGAFVVVDPYQTDYIEGKIYVVKLDEETFIKRIYFNNELKIIILKSINPKYDDIYIPKDNVENFKIMGRAVKFIYEGNL